MASTTRLLWLSISAGLLGADAQAEIGLDDPVSADNPAPPVIVVAAPERTSQVDTNEFVIPAAATNNPNRLRWVQAIQEQQEKPREYKYTIKPLPTPVMPDAELLRLRNKETFQGKVLRMTGESLVWRHPLALEDMEFRLDAIRQADFINTPSSFSTNDTTASVRLTNGDEVTGRLQSVTDSGVSLVNPRVGALNIRRASVARISQSVPGARRLYDGPRYRGEWILLHRGNVEAPMEAGSLLVGDNSPAVREVGLPDRTRIDLECTWRGNPTMNVQFYLATSEMEYEGKTQAGPMVGTQVNLWGGMVQLRQMRAEQRFGGFSRFESIQPNVFEKPGSGIVSLLISRPEGIIALLINGNVIKEWKNLEDFDAPGTGLGVGGNMAVNHISVREWDGRSIEGLVALPEQDALLLANHDKLVGHIQSVDAQTVIFSTAMGELKIPVDRVQEMVFATQSLQTADANPADALVVLDDGSRMTVAVDRLDEKALEGASGNFGHISIPRPALQQLCPRSHEN